MIIGTKIRKVREAKKLSQKEVALMLEMDQSQYSKIEKGKTDPTTTTLEKIARVLGVELADLFASDEIFRDVNSVDKSLMEKIRLIEQLDDKERNSIFTLIDSLITKKRLKDTLSDALQLV